ncbi:MAG: hypothetical protein WA997_02000 [Anaerolineales bacterium]
MRKYERSAVSEVLGDTIIYRNLIPVDPRLPALADIWEQIGLPSMSVPRKTTPEYARVVTHILEEAQGLMNPGSQIQRVVFVGDTRLNDGTAFLNICQTGNWSGMAFIAAEQDAPQHYDLEEGKPGRLFLANRWAALQDFAEYCKDQDFHIDDQTVVLLDLDKTTLGARGRNDQVIDQVRIKAANQTIRELLEDDYDEQVFSAAYQRLNQPEFHPFTADNQDYLVYICLILGSGLIKLEVLTDQVKSGKLATFDQFLSSIEQGADQLPVKLQRVHGDVFSLVNQGDPTPFKEFRHHEYLATAAHMGHLKAGTPVDEVLSQEITITHEVRQAALTWKEQGALMFGLSDKPDEASIPGPELAAKGYQAIHHIETDVVGA